MKKILMIVLAFAFVLPLMVITTGCSNSGEGYNASPIIRALATATPTNRINVGGNEYVDMPHIYDAFTDGEYNYFLLDIGTLQHTYVATIFPRTFTPGGSVTINMSETRTDTNSVTRGLTTSTSNSISCTVSASMGITKSASVQAGLPFARVSAGVSLTKNFSVSATATATRSWETNTTEAVSVGRTDSFGVPSDRMQTRVTIVPHYLQVQKSLSSCKLLLTTQNLLNSKSL